MAGVKEVFKRNKNRTKRKFKRLMKRKFKLTTSDILLMVIIILIYNK